MNAAYPNRHGQTYPEALPPSREVQRLEMEDGDDKIGQMVRKNFADFVFDDLVNQPPPRLFSSHMFGKKLLPRQMFDDGSVTGKGRLIVVVRNLKDSLVSNHFFHG